MHHWEESDEVNIGRQSLWGGSLASGGSGWDWGDAFRRGTYMPSSGLHWEEFRNLPGSLS